MNLQPFVDEAYIEADVVSLWRAGPRLLVTMTALTRQLSRLHLPLPLLRQLSA